MLVLGERSSIRRGAHGSTPAVQDVQVIIEVWGGVETADNPRATLRRR